MKKENIIILALIIALVFLLCNSYQGETNRTTTKIQTTTDTITKTDTIRINSIQIKEKLVYQAITRTDTIRHAITTTDTIRIPIPITTHTWKDTLYKIQVEGYKVRPLKIEIFPKTKYIHQTKTITNTIKPRKINFGIIAGYGIMLTPQKNTNLRHNHRRRSIISPLVKRTY